MICSMVICRVRVMSAARFSLRAASSVVSVGTAAAVSGDIASVFSGAASGCFGASSGALAVSAVGFGLAAGFFLGVAADFLAAVVPVFFVALSAVFFAAVPVVLFFLVAEGFFRVVLAGFFGASAAGLAAAAVSAGWLCVSAGADFLSAAISCCELTDGAVSFFSSSISKPSPKFPVGRSFILSELQTAAACHGRFGVHGLAADAQLIIYAAVGSGT